MDEETPHIEVRVVQVDDAPALHELDYDFETDRVYTLKIHDQLAPHIQTTPTQTAHTSAFDFSLVETPVDPPLYKDYRTCASSPADIESMIQQGDGGFVALANGVVAGGIFLVMDAFRSVTQIKAMIVGRPFRRYGVGTLLLRCALDWARNHDCRAILLETQNTNYPAIQFYLQNGLEIWSIHRHFYPPGPHAYEVAIFMGKRLICVPGDDYGT
jgi:GNAT superfamily N-acetyltransferase